MPEDYFNQFEQADDYFSQFDHAPEGEVKGKEEKGLIDKGFDLAKAIPGELSQFLGQHPIARRFVSGPSKEDLGGVELNAPTTHPGIIPGTERGAEYVRNKLMNTGDYSMGYLGGLIKEFGPEMLSGAFDPAQSGLRGVEVPGVRARGILAEEPKFTPLTKTPEPEIPKPKRQVKSLPPASYNIDLAGNVGVPEEGVAMPEGTTIVRTPQGTQAAVGRGKRGLFQKIEKPVYSETGKLENEGANLPDIEGEVIKPQEEVSPEVLAQSIDETTPGRQEEPIKTEEPQPKVNPEAQQYIDAIKEGKIPKTVSFADFKKNKESLMSRFMEEESGEFSPFEMFKKRRGVKDEDADFIRQNVVDSLIQGGRLDLEGIYSKTTGVSRKQFNSIVDEIIDTGAASRIAERIKNSLRTPEMEVLLDTLGQAKINRVEQDALNTQLRARQAAGFNSVKEEIGGKEGFFRRMAQMKGEGEKVTQNAVQLPDEVVNSLYDRVIQANNITTFEKARTGTALTKLLNGDTPARNELMLLDRVYGPGTADQIIYMHGGLGGVPLKIAKVANTMKTMRATLDMSAAFRQGLGLVLRKEFWGAFVDQFKYAASKGKMEEFIKGMEADPQYLFSRDSGLFTADHSLENAEEAFLTSYVGLIPGFRNLAAASERAYVGFLNQTRFNTFKSMIKDLEDAGFNTYSMKKGERVPTAIAREVADYINVASGRGSLGRLNKVGTELNALLFSPRLIASRLTLLNPTFYVRSNPIMRREALKTLFGIAGVIGTVDALGAVMGGTTKLTPSLSNLTNPDLGKVKWGRTRLDPGGGLLQYIVAASKFISGKATNSSSEQTYSLGKYGAPTRLSSLMGIGSQQPSFLENKLSPIAGLIDTILSGRKSISGEPINVKNEIAKSFIPLFLQDLWDLYQSDPKLMGLGIPAALGMGVQTYQEQNPKGLGAGMGISGMSNLQP